MSHDDFSDLKLHSGLLNNLASLGYHRMTPIQAQSLPVILTGKDLIAQAKTGSGKTAAFGLGLLQHLTVKQFTVQSLVLCPTRELADQVANEIRKLGRGIHNIKVLTLCGGMPLGPQIGSLEHGAHIIVGTPGRIEKHLRKGTLSLNQLKMLVLDEADRMLDMGFQASIDAIIKHTPPQRQTLLYSATYPKQIQAIAQRIMVEPATVTVATQHDNSTIEQHFYPLNHTDERDDAVALLLLTYRPDSAVVFCNTKRETQTIANSLNNRGLSTLALHGDLEQKQRNQTLVRFANKSISVLVATDVAARGLDIDALDLVINYQLAREPEVHTHRIGRTGRTGHKGMACTLFTANETYQLDALQNHLRQTLNSRPLPEADFSDKPAYKPPMTSLQIDGGKKQKLRPGDILGALTSQQGIDARQVGKIHIFDHCAYVAVNRKVAAMALQKLTDGTLKGRSFRVRMILNESVGS
ncbi:MAG: ATP-dependent RNA helicase DbpA [Cellvibrionaceae bacterium]|nr:ATP-dependent RNA helicase DbpA [Cellvibrionaceae bacterium]